MDSSNDSSEPLIFYNRPRRSSPKRKKSLKRRKSQLRRLSPKRKTIGRFKRRKSKTPKRKSRSPKRKSRSPKRKSRSPKRKSRSPKRKSRSPKRKSRSPKRKSRSSKRKSRSRNVDFSPRKRSKAGCKEMWKTLKHKGVVLPPKYEPHKIPIVCKGKEIILNPTAEEIATFYAKYLDTEYVTSKIFQKNFWNDWKTTLNKKEKDCIKKLDDVDFSKIKVHLDEINLLKKSRGKEEKAALKLEKEAEDEPYKVAIIDGKQQPVGNFRIEPPGIFLGRGCNPKLGKVKKRIQPEDIIINIGKTSEAPKPPRGHKWGGVVNDRCAVWLASWVESITGNRKYVYLAHSADFKKQSDERKFDVARNLVKKFEDIRRENDKNMKSRNLKTRQVATALYLIDDLALRVGNEKGADEADTVGVSSLRAEHIHLLNDETHEIELDFLGKDSIRYHQRVHIDELAYKNLKSFLYRKKKSEAIFDKISSKDINSYLKEFMPELTAKVFRTANASMLFQKELKEIENSPRVKKGGIGANVLISKMNKANAAVAILCNHQKKVAAGFENQMIKLDEQIKNTKEKI